MTLQPYRERFEVREVALAERVLSFIASFRFYAEAVFAADCAKTDDPETDYVVWDSKLQRALFDTRSKPAALSATLKETNDAPEDPV